MKRYFIVVFSVLFIFNCGAPDFEINNSSSEGTTFTLSYFYPTTENSRKMRVDIPVVFIFSENIDLDSALKGLAIEKTGPGQRQSVKPKCNYNENEFMLQCLPESGKWELKSNYSVKIKDVKSKDGTKMLDKEYSYIFSTI